MRRHEIDRGSDANYDPNSLSRRDNAGEGRTSNREQFFIKDGNAEILRLITRGKADDENIYVNIPPQQPQYIMVENGGKEILMKRFIDEQSNGKHIIREHYQVVPTQKLVSTDEMLQAQRLADDQSEIKLIHTNPLQSSTNGLAAPPESQLQHAHSSQSIQTELENSLKQQNALLRQILMEKEKLQEKYHQQETALETQSLPSHSMAIATQTDCEAGTQTEPVSAKPRRRRARSENDDSMTEDEYEYIRYSPPNSPEGVYWIKRRKMKRRSRGPGQKHRGRVVMVEQIKRKIRTPIKEESEEMMAAQSPPKKYPETRSSLLRRLKGSKAKETKHSASLNKDVLMEISDSFDEKYSKNDASGERRRRFRSSRSDPQVEFYDEESAEEVEIDSDNEIVIRRNHYSADSLEDDYSDSDEVTGREYRRDYRHSGYSRQGTSADFGYPAHSSHSIASTPRRISRKDSHGEFERRRRQATSEPPHSRSSVRAAPRAAPPERHLKKSAARSEVDLLHRWREDGFELTKPRYMEWYNKAKESENEKRRLDEYRSEKEKSKVSNKKLVGGIEKRIKSKATRAEEGGRFKPEPMPRSTPSKGARLLKEDQLVNKTHAPKIQTDSNHPLLQYSEHRYEHEYNPAPDIPVPPSKLPHYMYPETPPLASVESSRSQKARRDRDKPKPSPIHEHRIKESSSRRSSQADPNSSQYASKQLNASTLEDDHDSGIAMNSLLHSLGKRNPIADKKSVFTIAYDESKIKKIQSESDSPQIN